MKLKQIFFLFLAVFAVDTELFGAEDFVSDFSQIKEIKFADAIGEPNSWSFEKNSNYFKNSSGDILRIIKLSFSKKEAEKFINNQRIQMELLFAPQKAAYAGMISKEEACRNAPAIAKKIIRNKSSLYFFAEIPATAEGQYGSCGAREEPFISQRLVIFCHNSEKLFDIHFLRQIKSGVQYFKKPIANCL